MVSRAMDQMDMESNTSAPFKVNGGQKSNLFSSAEVLKITKNDVYKSLLKSRA
jgi:hypothetical protein